MIPRFHSFLPKRWRKLVAVKHLIRDEVISAIGNSYSVATRYRLRDLLLEAQALLHYPLIKHRNIVDLLAYGWDSGAIPYLVVDYADLGSLDCFLRSTSTTPDQKTQIAVDIASALELLHACDIVHGDLKLENVLVFADSVTGFTVKLSDFGFCSSDALGNQIYRGTSVVNAPEVRRAHNTSSLDFDVRLDHRLCDVYAYGISVWEIFNEGVRFYSIGSIQIAPEHVQEANSFLSHLDQDGADLIVHARGFIDQFEPGLLNASALKDVFDMTLARDPLAREEIRDARLALDPDDQ